MRAAAGGGLSASGYSTVWYAPGASLLHSGRLFKTEAWPQQPCGGMELSGATDQNQMREVQMVAHAQEKEWRYQWRLDGAGSRSGDTKGLESKKCLQGLVEMAQPYRPTY